jgi:radical SAM protein with 4Fe4S-binding SPASM domain
MSNFKPESFHLQWHITERCNLRCTHCYQDENNQKKEPSKEEIFFILEQFIAQIKKWHIPRRFVKVSITGGEPLVSKNFFGLIEKLYQNRNLFDYGVLTNGTFLTKDMVKKLKKKGINYAQISLEGMEKTNDSIRGKGVFKKIVNSAILLKKEKIKTNFSLTLTKKNLKDLEKVINLSKEIGILISVRRCVAQGRGKTENLLNKKEVRKMYHFLMEKKFFFGEDISFGCESGIIAQDFYNHYPEKCSAGYVSLTVLPNGDVYPCRRLPIFCGNLLKQNFDDLYNNSPALKSIRNQNINDKCLECFFYNRCGGGAKCITYGITGNLSSPDPDCWKI